MTPDARAYSVRTVREIDFRSTKWVWLEVREVTPSNGTSNGNGANPYTMVALVVPGGWISANLVEHALDDEEAWNRLVRLKVTRRGGLDIWFKYDEVPTGCYLNPEIVDELEKKLDELQHERKQNSSAASAAE